METIKISRDFSETPGGRYARDGGFSGEEFRDDILYPKYMICKKNNEKLTIDFDDTYGFATSFLEEAFGGIVRKYHIRDLLGSIVLVSQDDVTIPELVNKYIREAESRLK